MNEQVTFDGTDYYDSANGDPYYPIDYIWIPSYQDRKDYVIRQLGDYIECLVTGRLNTDEIANNLTLSEYIDRVTNRPKLIREHGSYTDFCNRIADEVAKATHGPALPDIDGMKAAYAKQIEKVVGELLEYRILQKVRAQLPRKELVSYLQTAFVKRVSSMASIGSKMVTEDFNAELSLCLTDADRKSLLETEYKTRLAIYKERTAKSEIAEENSLFFLAWQCFTTQFLNRTCSDFIEAHVNSNPQDTDFDLCIFNRLSTLTLFGFQQSSNIIRESEELASEWLVLEWIKNILSTEPFTQTQKPLLRPGGNTREENKQSPAQAHQKQANDKGKPQPKKHSTQENNHKILTYFRQQIRGGIESALDRHTTPNQKEIINAARIQTCAAKSISDEKLRKDIPPAEQIEIFGKIYRDENDLRTQKKR